MTGQSQVSLGFSERSQFSLCYKTTGVLKCAHQPIVIRADDQPPVNHILLSSSHSGIYFNTSISFWQHKCGICFISMITNASCILLQQEQSKPLHVIHFSQLRHFSAQNPECILLPPNYSVIMEMRICNLKC